MSIPKIKGYFTPTCDICGETLNEVKTHEEAVEQLRAEGWTSERQKDGSWENACPECCAKW